MRQVRGACAATFAGGNGQVGAGRNRAAEVGRAVGVPGELLDAGRLVQVTAAARRAICVIHDPVFRPVGRLEEAVVARPEHSIPLLEDWGGLLGLRAGAQGVAAS
jgi:hypothetical protein